VDEPAAIGGTDDGGSDGAFEGSDDGELFGGGVEGGSRLVISK
jgi:hypothetical protein